MDLMWVMGWTWSDLCATPTSVVQKAADRVATYVKLAAGGRLPRGR